MRPLLLQDCGAKTLAHVVNRQAAERVSAGAQALGGEDSSETGRWCTISACWTLRLVVRGCAGG